MQQHGGKDHNKKQPTRNPDPEAPRDERKNTRPEHLYGSLVSPRSNERAPGHDAGLD